MIGWEEETACPSEGLRQRPVWRCAAVSEEAHSVIAGSSHANMEAQGARPRNSTEATWPQQSVVALIICVLILPWIIVI